MKKRLLSAILIMAMLTALIPAITAQAITFVHIYADITGEVIKIEPALRGKFVYLGQNDEAFARIIIDEDVYIQGKGIEVGDTITAFYALGGAVAFTPFTGEILSMQRVGIERDYYFIQMEYTSDWIHSIGIQGNTMHTVVDFDNNFRSGRFGVGDTITGYYSPWNTGYIYDMPHYVAVFVVNGDYDVYLGVFDEGYIRNSFVEAYSGIKMLHPWGEPIAGLYDGDRIAVVLGKDGIEKAIVLPHHRRRELQITVLPRRDIVLQKLHVQPGILITDIRPIFEFPDIEILPMPTLPFTDPTLSVWAEQAVTQAILRGVIPHNLMSDFNRPITNVEFSDLVGTMYMAFLGGIIGIYDIPVLEQEIAERITALTGEDNINAEDFLRRAVTVNLCESTFSPYETITRERAAVVFSHLVEIILKYPIKDIPPVAFTDTASLAPHAVAAIEKMQTMGIMGGVCENTFSPNAIFTREQSIVTIMRIFDLWHHEKLARE
ncbi:MAG: S-layer homology domain-containing protein [Defluviitaleaceae bacterium]|nr:S-layer homology domain-containing protein [Defluviitaleaceae bacterium]